MCVCVNIYMRVRVSVCVCVRVFMFFMTTLGVSDPPKLEICQKVLNNIICGDDLKSKT